MNSKTSKPGSPARMSGALPQVYLVRHGKTAWWISGQHTGHTDIPLTEQDERDAQALSAQPDPDLMEWDYGAYEGRHTLDIRDERPGWRLLKDGCPGGEPLAELL